MTLNALIAGKTLLIGAQDVKANGIAAKIVKSFAGKSTRNFAKNWLKIGRN